MKELLDKQLLTSVFCESVFMFMNKIFDLSVNFTYAAVVLPVPRYLLHFCYRKLVGKEVFSMVEGFGSFQNKVLVQTG